ncbi:MAG: hypothetical protein ABIZ49_00275 [Opitutaceae bacterium]
MKAEKKFLRHCWLLVFSAAQAASVGMAATGAAAGAATETAPLRSKASVLTGSALQKVVTDSQRTAGEMQSPVVPASVVAPYQPAKPPPAAVASAAVVAARPPPNVPTVLEGKSELVLRLSRQAEEARAKGNWTAAVSSWREVETTATNQGDRETAAQAALNQARLLQSRPTAANDPGEKARFAQIVAKYETAVTGLPKPQQAFARNNLAVAYLQSGEPTARAKAIQVMAAMDWTTVDPAEVPLCRFNFGRAHELEGNREAALREYRKAIDAQPDHAPSVEGAFRILTAAGNLGAAAALGEELVQRGQARAVVPYLRALLEAKPGLAQADLVVVALARAFAGAATGPAAFAKEHAGVLDAIAKRTPAIGGLIADLAVAFNGDFPPGFSSFEQARRFPAWASSEVRRRALAELLRSVGDFHARTAGEKPATIALSRYSAAWSLDRQNTDAALYAAALLQAHRNLDRGGALLSALVEELFVEKGSRLAIAVKSAEDLKNLMRLHLVLAEIFEREGKWGPQEDPRTATFQLSHAIAIQEKLQATDASLAPSPEVYSRAGRAFAAARAPDYALEFHTKAAEGYLHFGAKELARESLKAAAAIPSSREVAYRERLDGVTQRLDQM